MAAGCEVQMQTLCFSTVSDLVYLVLSTYQDILAAAAAAAAVSLFYVHLRGHLTEKRISFKGGKRSTL